MALLSVEQLTVRFRTYDSTVHAVNGVSLALEPGETLGLVGESGCGKSVTSLAIMRLLAQPAGRIVSGRVLFNGVDLTAATESEMQAIRGKEIAMIFQDPMTSLNPVLTIREQMVETLRAHRSVNSREARDQAIELLGTVGIPQPDTRLESYPHHFSGGMRQRVMIAMALALQPKLLIADEPTTALDVTIQAQILELLRRLTAERGTAVVLITHDLGVVAGMADRVNVMYAGFVVETAVTTDLFEAPRHPYTVGLMHSIPRRDTREGELLIPIEGSPPDLRATPQGCPFAPRCAWRIGECWTQNPPLAPLTPVDDIRMTGPRATQLVACWNPPTSKEAAAGRPLRPGFIRAGEPATAAEGTARSLAAALPDDSLGMAPVSDITGGPPPAGEVEPAPAVWAKPDDRPLLEVENLQVLFPITRGIIFERNVGYVRAVDGISLSIRRGETLGLVGESGCGKSTAGRALVGLYRPTGGRILFDGSDIASLEGSALRRLRGRMQMIFQDPYSSLDPRMTAAGIVSEPLEIQGIGTRALRQERTRELLALVGLDPDSGDRYPHEFSGGQRQRIGVARALAVSPDLIVADEPVSALDVSIQAQIINLLQRLQKQLGLTYLFIAHDLSVVRHISDRIAVMYLGRIVEMAPSRELYAAPLHPYAVALLSAVPIPDPKIERRRQREILPGDVPNPAAPPPGCRFHTRCWLRDRLGRPGECETIEPALAEYGRGHHVACHFPGRVAEFAGRTPPSAKTHERLDSTFDG